MADRDPFGRDQSEDPLAAMGWSTSGTVGPETRPADVAVPEQADQAVRRHERAERIAIARGPRGRVRTTIPGMPGSRGRTGAGCGFAVAALLFVGFIGAVFVGVGLEGDVDGGRDPLPTPVERPATPDRPPQALEQGSMLRRGTLAPALRGLRRVTRSRGVRLVRIDPEQVLAQTATGGGGTKLAQATWDGRPSVLSTSPGGRGPTFGWADVDPSAPQRIVRAISRSGHDARSLDYVVLIDAAGLRWTAFLKGGGPRFSASPDGRAVSRVG